MKGQNQARDMRVYFKEKGDPGFSPEKNKSVINGTIKKYNLMRKNKMRDWLDEVGERSHAVASYLKSRAIESGKPIDQYLGRKTLAHLRGESIVNRIKFSRSMSSITPQDIVNASKTQKRTVKTQG
jgi:hypothetical protein